MKLAIICLLVFCAFETASAQLKKELANLYLKTMERVQNITMPVESRINVLVMFAKSKRIKIGSCESEASVSVTDFVNESEQEAQKCVDDATKRSRYDNAPSCCQKAVNTLKKDLSAVVSTLQTCIKKCIATRNCEAE